jgi:hypothetical protein
VLEAWPPRGEEERPDGSSRWLKRREAIRRSYGWRPRALVDSDTYATLEERDLNITRIASGSFVWKIRRDNNPFGLPKGTYDAANEGLWVYLRKGLPEGEYENEFGGDFPNVGFRQEITYNLIVV